MVQTTPYSSLANMVSALEDASQCSVVIGVEREFVLRDFRSGVSPDRDRYLDTLRARGERVVAERNTLQVEFNGSVHRELGALIAEHDETIARMRAAAAALGYCLDASCSAEPPCSLQVNCSLWKYDSNAFVRADSTLDLSSDSPLTRSIAGLLASYGEYRTWYCGDISNCLRRRDGSKESLLFVPRCNVWGVNNRAAAYRVCYVQNAPSFTRLENRVACSSADLSDCLYGTLASMLAGWRNDIRLDVNDCRLFGFVDPMAGPCLHAPL